MNGTSDTPHAAELADAELAAYIEASRADPPPSPREIGVEAMRGKRNRPPGPAMAEVVDQVVAGVPVRDYRPSAAPRGTVVFVHGGFWTIGDLDSHDRACRRLAVATNAAVVSVDIRRAPEHPWPAAVDDTVAVLGWAASGERPLIVMGDSSGGNLAALACLRLRDEGRPLPDAQVLAYPNTDLTLSYPSTREKATGWGLSTEVVAWGIEGWVPDSRRRADPAVSPVFADAHDLPPAVVVTAEHDPLRDEGEAYAAKLAEAGRLVTMRREPAMVHGFLTLDTVSPAAALAGERVFADVAGLIG